jgi:hypothetical protein
MGGLYPDFVIEVPNSCSESDFEFAAIKRRGGLLGVRVQFLTDLRKRFKSFGRACGETVARRICWLTLAALPISKFPRIAPFELRQFGGAKPCRGEPLLDPLRRLRFLRRATRTR